VCGSARVFNEAQVFGSARVYGSARVCGSAQVAKTGDHWCVTGLEHVATYTLSDDSLAIGCQRKTVAQWRKDSSDNAPLLRAFLGLVFPDLSRLSQPPMIGGCQGHNLPAEPLALHVGKTYRDGHGRDHLIVECDPDRKWHNIAHPFITRAGRSYTASGVYCADGLPGSLNNLVEQVV
jgi:hypothetical protein